MTSACAFERCAALLRRGMRRSLVRAPVSNRRRPLPSWNGSTILIVRCSSRVVYPASISCAVSPEGRVDKQILRVCPSRYRRYRSTTSEWFEDQLHWWCKDRWRRRHGCAQTRHIETPRFMMPFGLAATVFNVVFAIRCPDYPSVSDVPSTEESVGSHAHSSKETTPT